MKITVGALKKIIRESFLMEHAISFANGDHVMLLADPLNGFEDEEAIVNGDDDGSDVYVVTLINHGSDDDGMREVTADQMRLLQRAPKASPNARRDAQRYEQVVDRAWDAFAAVDHGRMKPSHPDAKRLYGVMADAFRRAIDASPSGNARDNFMQKFEIAQDMLGRAE